jgi:hypothetical protein
MNQAVRTAQEAIPAEILRFAQDDGSKLRMPRAKDPIEGVFLVINEEALRRGSLDANLGFGKVQNRSSLVAVNHVCAKL